jgi:hypothetical protein
LRYTAATRVYEACRSLERPDRIAWEAVADIAGHATIAMATAKKYSQQKRRAQIAVGHLNAALGLRVKPDQKV